MDDLLKQIGANIAEQVTRQVLENVQREMREFNKQSFEFCYSELEAAKKLGVSLSTIQRTRKTGEIDYSRSPSGKPVYLPRHIIEYLLRHEIRTGKPSNQKIDEAFFPQLKLAS